MNIFFHVNMFPEIFLMAVYGMKAREEVKEINRLAKEQGIKPKYVKLEGINGNNWHESWSNQKRR